MALSPRGKGGSVLAWHVQCKCLATHNLNEELFKTIYLCSPFSFSICLVIATTTKITYHISAFDSLATPTQAQRSHFRSVQPRAHVTGRTFTKKSGVTSDSK